MAPVPATSISPAELARRRDDFASVERTLAIEGLTISPRVRPFFEKYAEGLISEAELEAAIKNVLLK